MLLVDYDKRQPVLADKKRGSNHFKTDRRKKAQSVSDCAFFINWHAHGESNPGYRRERAMS